MACTIVLGTRHMSWTRLRSRHFDQDRHRNQRRWRPKDTGENATLPYVLRFFSGLLLSLPMFPAPSQEKVAVISPALSWVVLLGNALACILLFWESLSTVTPRHWPSVASSGSMLLFSLLSSLAYLIVTLHGRANSQFFLTLLPLTSSALIAGMYVLTAPHLSLKPQHRVVLMGLIVAVSLSLLSLFLFGLRTA
jgi:hypothetical protein